MATWKRTTHSQHEVLFTQTTGLLGGPAGPARLHTSAAPRAVTVHAFNKASIVQVQTHPNKYINNNNIKKTSRTKWSRFSFLQLSEFINEFTLNIKHFILRFSFDAQLKLVKQVLEISEPP